MLTGETDIEIDQATAALPFSPPAAVANEEWTQSGGIRQVMGHFALGSSLGTAWSVSIGAGNNRSARLASAPVIGGGRAYTIDTVGTVRAFDTRNGGQVWSTSFGADVSRDSNYGGGVAARTAASMRATARYVAALDAATGGAAWTVKPGGPLRGSPTAAGDAVYVMSQDNQIYSPEDRGRGAELVERGGAGDCRRVRVGRRRSPPVPSSPASRPASSTPIVMRTAAKSGRTLSRDQHVDQRRRFVRHRRRPGDRWRPGVRDRQGRPHGRARTEQRPAPVGQNIAGIATPWVAGEWVFVVTDEAKLIALQRNSGRVRWINQLPRWENPKGKKGPIFYSGPVLAGDR